MDLEALGARVRVPTARDKVYKTECVLSFDTPESDGGLFVCLNTFLAFSRKWVEVYHQRTGHALFLNIQTFKAPIPETEEERPAKKPTIMAIGVEGGFDVGKPKYEYTHVHTLVVLPSFTQYPLPDPELPARIQESAAGVLSAEAVTVKQTVDAWTEARVASGVAASLVQLDNGVKIPPSNWKCSMCELADNLWMNMTDGTILCGRKNFDGTGGNGHAAEYYKMTSYPIVVKLGTITPEGADVYSYPEDDMVLDPLLGQHLTHFGINMQAMKKTSLSMAEMEIELNQRARFESERILGASSAPLFGPGLTGMINMGNSCYLNSVMQVLFSLDRFSAGYLPAYAHAGDKLPEDPAADLGLQMAKLAYGLLSGEYSKPVDGEALGITPRSFKSLIGLGHPEFSTGRQQDALEFMMHVFDKIHRASVADPASNPVTSFTMALEHRYECSTSHQVQYRTSEEKHLLLPVPLSLATNKEEVAAYEGRVAEREKKEKETGVKIKDEEPPVLPHVPFERCVEIFFGEEEIDQWFSPAINAKTKALHTTRLGSFPKYLVVGLSKFFLAQDWTPKKKAVSVPAPLHLDLTSFRGRGLQPGEVQMADAAPPPAAPAVPEPPAALIEQLTGMGFSANGAKRALIATSNNPEAAMEWIFAHMADPDFNDPLPAPAAGAAVAGGGVVPSDENIAMIESMGFTRAQAEKALKATDNNIERATDWIFSHMGQMEEDAPAAAPPAAGAAAAAAALPEHSGKYRLKAFISHMGTSTQSGHYVCHIHKDGGWVLFNDEKVQACAEPPFDMGYIYLYESE